VSPPRIPTSTYRLQFGPSFTFDDARTLAGYLRRLGVGDVYASPVFAARGGSEHGYDVVDPTRLSDDLGGRKAFDAMSGELSELGLGLLLDIVPNHMAASAENPWWWDVLRHGRRSAFASFFDIDWAAGNGQVLVPVLGSPFGRALEAGEIAVGVEDGEPVVRYHEHRFPVDPRSFEARDEDLPSVNGTPGDPGSFDVLEALLNRQHYRLADWRIAAQEIVYRRFFDISDLVSLRVEDPAVFDAAHALVLELVQGGVATGLRVDHVDGLRDPAGYLARLRQRLGDGYVAVEKILGRDEALREDWPVAGATGYELSDWVEGLFVDPSGAERLLRAHAAFVAAARRGGGRSRGASVDPDFGELAARCKREVLDLLFAGEGRTLAAQLHAIAHEDRHGRDLSEDDLREALAGVMAWLPVYRTYTTGPPVADDDRRVVDRAVRAAARAASDDLRRAVEFVGRVLLLDTPAGWDPTEVGDWVRFVVRWQRLTGPVAAKGVEDTALYRWDGLLSRSEVGGDPSRPSIPVEEFHRRMRERQRRWPGALNAGSTHDSKRSEDVRARLHVLSEIPDEWERHLRRWRRRNASHARRPRGVGVVPDASFELHLYQTMVGVWPLDPVERGDLVPRIQDYAVKAARESKVHTSWLAPATTYERALRGWVRAVLADARFRGDLEAFVERVAAAGATNSLAALVLRATAPGVPDVYQGTELWSFSLVDPDNRRAVDFGLRADALEQIEHLERDRGRRALVKDLAVSWRDGRVKLHVLRSLLHLRRDHEGLFADGAYVPLEVTGRRRGNVVAFARRSGPTWAVTVAPRLTASFAPDPRLPAFGRRPWPATVVRLPGRAPARWRNVLTGEHVETVNGRLRVGDAFARFPVAVLVSVRR
jgi:(1->4)-alpha-D-glucan 1-alpha-D-glucosylmutase